MKFFLSACFCAIMLFGLCACGNRNSSADSAPPVFDETTLLALAQAQAFDMQNGNFASTADTFHKDVAKKLNEKSLQKIWQQTTADLGTYVAPYSAKGSVKGQYFVVTLVEEYESTGLKITLSYNEKQEICGLFFSYQSVPAPLVTTDRFTETAVTIGETFPLDGILTLPSAVEHPPVVLLVHGSGATDRNETIYQNTPFADLAHGLAEQGIASLRYDKRYFTYPEEATAKGTALTLEDEVLEDVDFALDLLAQDTRIDCEQIFVLGHSLGGGLTPYIATTHDDLAGIISMAGTLRPLYELSYDQNKALETSILQSDENVAKKLLLKIQMLAVEKEIRTLRESLDTVKDSKTLLGMPAAYQKSAKAFAGEQFIEAIDLPILVLQGTADFQVYADKDYPLWETALSGRENVTLHLYEGLNHLMMPTSGKTDVSEYETKSTVSQDVIDDIALFILNAMA